MKVGDILICKKVCTTPKWSLDDGSNAHTTTIGKIYTITGVMDTSIQITNDNNEHHHFSLEKDNAYYGKWFYSQQELRKQKLKNLGHTMEFKISAEQEKKLKKWQNAIKEIYGEYGNFEFRFRPTGIDDAITVWSDLAKTSIDLTDVSKW